ncbi:MAG TPA: oxaloacetate decarboxylase subunit alpha [Pseudomonas sp.]|jgi:oxaloacetate decarboxylase alpha subunit|uniref:Oxaloacetate decarboxylase subunit alpha n=1 Tax=Halopseudomonas pachastrellae TaxID=254161 RepID=A0A1S8DIW2_9GAMM|nr:sodium-extruding oxaloacetate decarboxylase subunit alpha [Halopseudomonas pachastrellae]MAB41460.1 oxaloacetate decarboxylase subunit alpha [Pseudomonadales bacterium]MAQ52266.1 oxaloacetate decarboxylase subunit alpha [Pseudomonas sp.]MBB50041.1 oxaloacetate decarboxylase subunit alpha [Pseudomonadales bacterium]MBF77268.1 oxaloacetate decarboxylase subunit alpha [Pseudomonadales bacterium]ONM45294.1 oxaloacetate decarboxylase subunit alpha [Halopseudomonas pachastrellae]|tara:strand:+ start:2281 stop:4059 length:1779 start_codon:yes stop_codon:yes gene_type:complete
MTDNKQPLGITDVILRDAHQSILATRMRLDDMLPIAGKLDQVGFWSVESWGGATFDACIRYLGEDPWERIRALKKAMPNTRQQMLLRGQNLLGYRHYADDVVEKFVERAAVNGVDVFRVFDAMNDPRNLETALKAVKAQGKHAQGTISYTTSPVHTLQMWVDLAKQIEDMGADSIAIKDMAGILNPYVAFDLVSQLKSTLSIPVHMQCHATAGLSTAAILKAAEAGIDNVDSAISSMSMTYGHSPTESVVAIFQNSPRDTGLNLELLEEVAAYFREVRKKYAKFEGNLRGVDSRILVAQVPGGMLTNMENQLKEQGASDKFDEVLAEIPRVREDLGFIPLVTPTSQIVGTQAVINVLTGERYKSITKETAGVLKGEYGAAPAAFNAELQARVLDGAQAITCRPADLLEAEMDKLTAELKGLASEKGIKLAENEIDDVLTYALFPQIGLKFLENRGNPDAFEPVPTGNELPAGSSAAAPQAYTVAVNGKEYVVQVTEGGDISGIKPIGESAAPAQAAAAPAGEGEPQVAPLSGNIFKVLVSVGDAVEEGDVVMILEAMKMETEVRTQRAGTVASVDVKVGDAVAVGDTLLTIG